MLEALRDYETPVEFLEEEEFASLQTPDTATPKSLVDAKYSTAQFLEKLGVPPDAEIDEQNERAAAQTAFANLALTNNTEQQRLAIANLETPEAVKHLVGMLTAYDWAFVEQAQEIRGYTVAKIMEETTHPDARIRLKALEMLGRVTEVALFTDRVEVKRMNMSDDELEKELRAKLERFMGGMKDVTDVEALQ